MISCPTDFYSNTGDCNVEVGDYTGDYADVAARDTSAPETGHDNDGHFSPSLLADMDAPTDGIEDTTLNEPGLAARKLAKRMSAKPIFHICNDDAKLRNRPTDTIRSTVVSKLIFFSSGDMINKKNGYTLNSFLSYGPLNPSDCDDYSFSKIATPAAS